VQELVKSSGIMWYVIVCIVLKGLFGSVLVGDAVHVVDDGHSDGCFVRCGEDVFWLVIVRVRDGERVLGRGV